MPTWTVKADRRRADYHEIARRLQTLEDSIQGLSVSLVDVEHFEKPSDAGDLRDFAPVARMTHDQLEGLEVVAEELVVEFGWVIDLGRDDE